MSDLTVAIQLCRHSNVVARSHYQSSVWTQLNVLDNPAVNYYCCHVIVVFPLRTTYQSLHLLIIRY